MAKKEFGVLTEQAYPCGQFGFDKLNEQDSAKVQKDLDKDKTSKSK